MVLEFTKLEYAEVQSWANVVWPKGRIHFLVVEMQVEYSCWVNMRGPKGRIFLVGKSIDSLQEKQNSFQCVKTTHMHLTMSVAVVESGVL